MNDKKPGNPSPARAAAEWSAQNEKQKPAMTPAEERGLNDAKEAQRRPGAGDSAASKETFPRRLDPPGKVGLANEVRPGLGTRAQDDGVKPLKGNATKASPQDAEPAGRNAPLNRPEPREQAPDSAAHEQERSTGVSGHSGAT